MIIYSSLPSPKLLPHKTQNPFFIASPEAQIHIIVIQMDIQIYDLDKKANHISRRGVGPRLKKENEE